MRGGAPSDPGAAGSAEDGARGAPRDGDWDGVYERRERLWGERPSELAKVAVDFIGARGLPPEYARVLDVGCGYGRDARFLHDRLGLPVHGIDRSAEAIAMAVELSAGIPGLTFERRELGSSAGGGRPATASSGDLYGAVLTAQVYHLLRPGERRAFRGALARALAPGGLFFLSTLSPRDPEHFGKGRPVPDEPFTFVEKTYLHFCRREELASDFAFADMERLDEIEVEEPRADGSTHHHILWMLVGRQRAGTIS